MAKQGIRGSPHAGRRGAGTRRVGGSRPPASSPAPAPAGTPSLTLRRVPISRIKPAAYNPRQDLAPGDAMFDRLVKSLDEFGCVEPLVWNQRTGHLVGGHQRLKALAARGETHADVSVVDLPLTKEKALNLALNRIQGEWDGQRLAALLEELTSNTDLGFDLEATGFDLGESRAVMAEFLADSQGLQSESFDAAAAEEEAQRRGAVTQPGEIITLGREAKRSHRLLCGDCTDAGAVRRLMQGERAALFATDPPYLVGYDGTNHPGPRKGSSRRAPKSSLRASRLSTSARPPRGKGKGKDWSPTYGVTWDDAQGNDGLYEGFVRVAIDEAIEERAAWYCWHASRRQAMVERVWNDAGAFVHCQVVWVKNRPVLTRTWYLWKHEPCFMGWLKGKTPRRVEQRRLPTVWEFDTLPSGPERPDHPTPKPLELFEIPMLQHTRPGEVCYEPFAGSGTQVIAAERLNRRCFAAEVSPVYCDVIVRRFIAFAGEGAVAPEVARKYRLAREPRAARAKPARTPVVKAKAKRRIAV